MSSAVSVLGIARAVLLSECQVQPCVEVIEVQELTNIPSLSRRYCTFRTCSGRHVDEPRIYYDNVSGINVWQWRT